MIASLALFVIATTDKVVVVVAIVIIYIGITTCSLSNTYHSSKLLGSLHTHPPGPQIKPQWIYHIPIPIYECFDTNSLHKIWQENITSL